MSASLTAINVTDGHCEFYFVQVSRTEFSYADCTERINTLAKLVRLSFLLLVSFLAMRCPKVDCFKCLQEKYVRICDCKG